MSPRLTEPGSSTSLVMSTPATVLSSGLRSPSGDGRRVGKAVLLRRFLNAYWLRPENALWMALRSLTLAKASFGRPSIDISCGDGIFSFLHRGGTFEPEFDVFTSVAVRRAAEPHGDMFDHVADDYRPRVETAPVDRIDVGTDCKPSMLEKAERLRLYDRLLEHDNNLSFPFDDATFQTVYCNAVYWVRNIDDCIAELRRITRPSGAIILQVKLDSMTRFTLRRLEPFVGKGWLDTMDGSRFACWPTLADRATWENRFASAGLAIESATPFVTRTHAHLWDVGLRPIAPLLIRMANALTPETRAAIKSDWVDLFCDLLEPLCDPRLDFLPGRDEPAEIQYVLTAR